MENQVESHDPGQHLSRRKNAGTNLRVRPQYTEAPFHEVIEDPGASLLLEYWDILRRRKGTLVVIAFLGLVSSLLLTLPDTALSGACFPRNPEPQ